ncbi:Fe-S cluster assembly protein HesB [Candidatus Woesearchaeota archaeon]|nr:Fe-S cluster assembly protein HesB [Candidatus Woesearchaeota archaeon]
MARKKRYRKEPIDAGRMAVSQKRIFQFRKEVLVWYAANQRNLPWRKTNDPYSILISEVMLQQTQVDRVIPYYLKFIKKYPSLDALAGAQKKAILRLWSGLGFNSRAVRLKQLAAIISKSGGKLPMEEKKLRELPGIGNYTANAILAFAYNKKAPVIDTNIRRALIHRLRLPESISQQGLSRIAMRCIPENRSRIWHNALMDYGALEMTAKKTGIKPVSKQGKFKSSERQVRGQIVKILLKNPGKKPGKKPGISINALKKKFPGHVVLPIVRKMSGDGLVSIKGGRIFLG